jgi:hypothetical protein
MSEKISIAKALAQLRGFLFVDYIDALSPSWQFKIEEVA